MTHSLKKSGSEKLKKRKKEKRNGDERFSKKDEIGIKNAVTANLTSKVLEDEKMKNKRRKVEMSDNLKSLFSTKGGGNGLPKNDFMSRGYTIPDRG